MASPAGKAKRIGNRLKARQRRRNKRVKRAKRPRVKKVKKRG